MRLRAGAILALLILGMALAAGTPRSTAAGVDLQLAIPGEPSLSTGNGVPVLIAGVWHDLQLSLDSPVQDTLVLEATAPGFQAGNMSSHYRWEWSAGSSSWADPLYGFFVSQGASSVSGTAVALRMGLDAAAETGDWSLAVEQDGVLLETLALSVRAPQMGYGLSSADFTFRAEPFQQMALSSEDVSQYLRVINNGNVPLRLDVTFNRLQTRLTLANPSDVAHIYQDQRYFVRLDLDPRPPQIIPIEGTARVEVEYVIPSPGASQLIPSFETNFNLQVVVGRSGYIVYPLGNVYFQTIETLRADFNALVTWQVYLTGDQDISLDITAEEAELVGVQLGEDPLTLPATLSPSPNAELPVTVQVRATVPSTSARILFTITLLDTGEVQTFTTTIAVGGRPADSPLEPSLLWFFASLISASVLALVSYNHWKFITLGPAALRLERKARRGGAGKSRKGKRAKTTSANRKERMKKGPEKVHGTRTASESERETHEE